MGCQRVLSALVPAEHAPSRRPLTHDHEHLELRPHPAAPSAARRWVMDQIRGLDVPADSTQVLSLLVSEMVTNAVIHARTAITVGVTPLDGAVLVTVSDRNLVEPEQQPYSSSRPSGRGIALIEALAEEWGVVSDDFGKTVWCTVRASDLTDSTYGSALSHPGQHAQERR